VEQEIVRRFLREFPLSDMPQTTEGA
jgi:hypothetical protein